MASAIEGDFLSDFKAIQDLQSESISASTEKILPLFRNEVGRLLGDLNSIGGLRSGSVKSGTEDLLTTFADRVALSAREGFGESLSGALSLSELRERRRQFDKERSGGFLKGVGTLLARGAAGFASGGLSEIPGAIAFGASALGGKDKNEQRFD